MKEDLIAWIPDNHYQEGFKRLSKFNDILKKTIECEWNSRFVSNDDPNPHKTDIELDIIRTDLDFDLNFITNKVLYSGPLISSNLKHVQVRSDPRDVLYRPLYDGSESLIPRTLITNHNRNNPKFSSYTEALRIDGHIWEMFFEGPRDKQILAEFLVSEEGVRFAEEQTAVFDGILSSLAVNSFASKTNFPVRTFSSGSINYKHDSFFEDEAYQLIKIQFESLRYPVLENIDDVLRLRDNKHLDSYRNVITEYSNRLRTELESEKWKVLDEFKRDLELSTKSLFVTNKWSSRVADLAFYASIPLALIGIPTGIPLSDAILIPVTGAAKYVSDKKRKELDWIMFGRP